MLLLILFLKKMVASVKIQHSLYNMYYWAMYIYIQYIYIYDSRKDTKVFLSQQSMFRINMGLILQDHLNLLNVLFLMAMFIDCILLTCPIPRTPKHSSSFYSNAYILLLLQKTTFKNIAFLRFADLVKVMIVEKSSTAQIWSMTSY